MIEGWQNGKLLQRSFPEIWRGANKASNMKSEAKDLTRKGKAVEVSITTCADVASCDIQTVSYGSPHKGV
jgi:hypothetical protein